ncbi:M10 family metallopeptidase C-terminal domain-containing protein [uncultured Pelagimonas sp.]|uniref:M10 family metallopeptidase C-terminal domain-containing protein n=1 Tax=uncultured Pelagimonas sp. TaxID=1618102 RepID=UPI00261C5871|nr:M10 family metallopeptidase C-terminal domain-containing protein [uncultured Pelagimonas sp.]
MTSGDDSLRGDSGGDTLYGNSGEDLIRGTSGNNVLSGGNDNDRLYGDSGNDRIIGGTGRDVMTGGADADTFVWRSESESPNGSGRDQVTDFQRGSDHLDLSDLHDDLVFVTTSTGRAGQVWYDQGQDLVQVDLDGSGTADVSIELLGVSSLTAGDFILS